MRILTREQMREMDRRTIEGGHAPGLTLMERAGHGILRSLLLRAPQLASRRVLILCGKGNNGGDGFVLARLLRNRGRWPDVWSLAAPEEFTGDAAAELRDALAAQVPFTHLTELSDVHRRRLASLEPRDIVVDALFGTGFRGELGEPARSLVAAVNASSAAVLAVDLPSGLDADLGSVEGEAVRASWTVTMAAPKRGFAFEPGRSLIGDLDIVDIGIPPDVEDAVLREVGPPTTFVDFETASQWIPGASGRSHKGRWGKVVLLGGSPGLDGAPQLAARAALRCGAGLLRLGLPESLERRGRSLLEAMTVPLPEGESGQLLAASAEQIMARFGDWDALGVGPGLGRFPETERLVMKLLGTWRGPLVLDADALAALASWGPDSWVPRAREVRAGGEEGGLVLTPHAGELSRLTGVGVDTLLRDPVSVAVEWAARWNVTLVFKGAPTVTAAPDGRAWINGSGNSGLATGGSGDVLTGIVLALLGQGVEGPRAAALASYLHGLAADLQVARPAFAQRALLPGDVVDGLPAALAALESCRDESATFPAAKTMLRRRAYKGSAR